MFRLRRPSVKMASVSSSLKRKSSENGEKKVPNKKPMGHWSMGLKASMEDPEMKVFDDEKVVIIKDKYPKARHHFLSLPRENISSLKALRAEHLPLLKHMQKAAEDLVSKIDTPCKFRHGYHAVPSMSHIHLHSISQDFDSPCLKTKVHWNSFTSDYFVESEDVITMLEELGKVVVDADHNKSLLKRDLKCHVCHKELPTMPALKQHILHHIPKKAT